MSAHRTRPTGRRRRAVLAVGIAVMVLGALPALAAEPAALPRLTIQPDGQARQGGAVAVTITLTGYGRPLAGETVSVLEEVGFFDYVGTHLAGEVRTDHEGTATLAYTPHTHGEGRLIAEFAGNSRFAPATAVAVLDVTHGVSVVTPVSARERDPLLPRGVTAWWFMPLLVGVWAYLGTSVYHLVRIPRVLEHGAEKS